ncbi:FAD-dependent oxidoreductase [Nocardia sp. NPDC056000]|uniref:FAD-dependent oxidoreductase n=1 Tax=Nocardia sp. NPDC056000 TaxID=3345674 RepID=UPI0035DE7169
MPHIVTQSCCNDASCVYACPVNCIHPTPDEPDFGRAEMLYIDPAACVDCGACAAACPVDAIVPHTKLTAGQQVFVGLNADFYSGPRPRPPMAPVPSIPRLRPARTPLRVAIIGSGPAAMYAADELLRHPGIRVNVFERLSRPHGLARFGVAPDHTATRQVTEVFDTIARQDGFAYHLGVEVGRDISHAELLEHHHAVIYAVGAATDRTLGIPGEDLPGSASVTELVAWYNGHPEYAGREFDLSHERAVVIGNGNVALDVARVLTTDPDRLATTAIAPHALQALRRSRIREVVVIGRRGVAQAAYTMPELAGLARHPDARLHTLPAEVAISGHPNELIGPLPAPHEWAKIELARAHAGAMRADGERRIILRYLRTPIELLGPDRVHGIILARNEIVHTDGEARAVPTGDHETLEAGLVLRSVGYRGTPVRDLPFDAVTATVPHRGGRVVDPASGDAVPGTYVAGWIKRGPSGFLGTNKSCSRETVDTLLADAERDPARFPVRDDAALRALLTARIAGYRSPETAKPLWRKALRLTPATV